VSDQILRFSFSNLPVRGQYVRLTKSWLAATEQQHYAPDVRQSVGEAMAAATLLADGIKFDGRVALQATSDGLISTLLGECAQRHLIRGIARMNEQTSEQSVHPTPGLGDGRLAISLIPDKGEMHQGVVELTGNAIDKAIEQYFLNSEQLPTRIQMASDENGIAAMLLQRLPDTSPLPCKQINCCIDFSTKTTSFCRPPERSTLVAAARESAAKQRSSCWAKKISPRSAMKLTK